MGKGRIVTEAEEVDDDGYQDKWDYLQRMALWACLTVIFIVIVFRFPDSTDLIKWAGGGLAVLGVVGTFFLG
jgi:cell division protein FtsW (lipid II flippase)